MPARSTAALSATAPNCGAGMPLKAPWNLPMGVRAALRMTTSLGWWDMAMHLDSE